MRRPARRTAALCLLGAVTLGGACTAAPADPRAVPAPPGAPPSATTPPPPPSFTVVATGDVLIHPALTEQAARDADGAGEEFDYRPLFQGIRPLISRADLALCHLEVPLAEDGGPYSGYPQFNAPPELAGALADTGYDGCSTASNHVLDQGPDGVTRTLDALDEAGLRHTGAARSEREATTPLLFDVDGTQVGHLSYTFSFNGFTEPGGTPWLANELDPAAVVADAEAARAAGADVVIASLHWGQEYQHDPTEEQRRLARQLLAEDSIDLLIGHHAHVVQPIERIDGEWVAYGLGNSVARHAEPRGVSEEGIAARFRFTRDGDRWVVETAEYVPTLVELGPPIRLVDLTSSAETDRRAEALERTDGIVLSRGGAEDGLTRPGR
ncbi:poly-gamma-glutamate synthesis protein (capsule biosynthesis protein) [Prauserella shujinwangii]|uniref:Poly-gamma-glutamate synthesis protein (Capsule biosynthesis protein) n=1 Tax=Prauserella shujinwangii TaxID=1453103 RepID=A0A2T0M2U0_9PSEU|nr:CapA family protein [Prauserella shujinwangii]PRX51032.1 poly-gamma-glutamate synthesis protein (capsule biosynthesis protein) [Prauserella shujinwangii]